MQTCGGGPAGGADPVPRRHTGPQTGAADSASGPAGADTPDHVRYLLLPPQFDHQPPSLAPVITRPRRDGGYSLGRRLTLNGLAQSTAKGVTSRDRMLARLILAGTGPGYMPGNSLPREPEQQADLMERLFAAQTLHWQSLDGPALRPGPPRRCIIGWSADDAGRQVPALQVLAPDGETPDKAALPLDRGGHMLWYVDPGQGLCGPLEPPAPPALVKALLRAPPLDPVAAGLVAQRLPSLALPVQAGALRLPVSTTQVETDDRPPVIRLVLTTHPPHRQKQGHWQPPPVPADRAYLAFDYDGKVVPFNGGPAQFRTVRGDRITLRPRRQDVEKAALQRLAVQATDRAHRIGQDKPVFVYRLVAEGTVEERILELQDRKRQLAAAIHDVGAESPGALTEADIDRLFAPLTG